LQKEYLKIMIGELKRVVIGSPLETARQVHERLNKSTALAVFSSDAMSSSAYATEEILRHLALANIAGMAAFQYAGPIAGLVALLLIIVVFSFRQTIAAYPTGGGSYIVATDNLGRLPGLVAGAALLIDYVLTVAVSISAGVAALTSLSVFRELADYRVFIAVGAIALIMLANLRGLRESGALFRVPTYLFLATVLLMIGYALVRMLMGQEITITPPSGPLVGPNEIEIGGGHLHTLTFFLLMQSFASGCAALTGVEAIADGVPAFKAPEATNARITLVWMAGLLLTMFLGITWLSSHGAEPREVETILSQIGRGVFGSGSVLHVVLQFSTAGILFLAANTAFADFPRVCFFLARDRFLPRQFSTLGDRLVFSNGILLLSFFSAVLVVIYNASVTNLIPLYAVGVFLGFTLSQTGMVRRWFRLKTAGWQRSAFINGIGAVTTFVVMCVIVSAKFAEGAWMVVMLLPILVLIFLGIHRHYVNAAKQLSLEGLAPPPPLRNTVIVPVSTLHRGVINALAYAQSIAPGNVTAVHVSMDPEQTAKVCKKWEKWGNGVPLVVLDSPYRSLVRPLMRYIDEIDKRWDNDVITVVLPEFVPARWWHNLLHNQTALLIKGGLLFRKNRVVTSVPYRLDQ
jgi:amino acid transporter